MSQENVEVMRRAVEAFNRRELLLNDLDPEVEWVEDQRFPGAETFRGPAGVERSVKNWWDAWSEITMHSWRSSTWRSSRGRRSYPGSRAWKRCERHGRVRWLYEFRRGKIVRVQILGSRAEALEAAGLQA